MHNLKKFLSLATIIVSAAFSGICLYAYQLGSISEEQEPRDSSQPTVGGCTLLPDAIPVGGWDAIASIPGTDVTFRYPSEGFFSQPSTLTTQADVNSQLQFVPTNEQHEDPFVTPSFPLYLNSTAHIGNEDDLMHDAVMPEEDLGQDTNKALVEINDRIFLLQFFNVSYGYVSASTIHHGQMITVGTIAGAYCHDPIDLVGNALFLDFLRHMEFNASPVE